MLGEFIAETSLMFRRLERQIDKERFQRENERKEDRKEWNKNWGDLANKMGRIVENIVAPAAGSVIKKYFKCDLNGFFTRGRRKSKKLNLEIEIDMMAITDDRLFVLETKSSPAIEHVQKIVKKRDVVRKLFPKLFPEYQNKEIILIFSGLRFDEDNVIEAATKEGIYIMAYREWEYMDILNFDNVNKSATYPA